MEAIRENRTVPVSHSRPVVSMPNGGQKGFESESC